MPAFGLKTAGELWDEHAVWLDLHRAKNSTKNKRYAWRRHLAPAFGALAWRDITPSVVDAYVQKRLSQTARNKRTLTLPATVNFEISTLKAMLSWAVSRKLIPESPLTGYAHLTTEDSRDFAPTETDVMSLLRRANPVFRLMLVIAFETGMRRDEIRLLEPGEIDWDNRIIRLPARRTKTRKARDVPVSDLCYEVLRLAQDRYEAMLQIAVGKNCPYLFASERDPDVAIGVGAIQHWMARARREAGVRGPRGQAIWFHSLRKSFASLLAGSGQVSIYVLMNILGHTSKAAHDKYTQMTPDHRASLRRAIDERRKGSEGAAAQADILRLVKADKKPA